MTVHRSRLRTTPEVYARASLLHDGAVLSLPTVAHALGVTVDVAARLVALGRLHASGEILVLPPGCGRHLAGMVLGSRSAAVHVLHCEGCAALRTVMEEGIRVARARWTSGAGPVGVRTHGGVAVVPVPPQPGPRVVAQVPAPPMPAHDRIGAHRAAGRPGTTAMTLRAVRPSDGARPCRLHRHRVEAFRWATAPAAPAAPVEPPVDDVDTVVMDLVPIPPPQRVLVSC